MPYHSPRPTTPTLRSRSPNSLGLRAPSTSKSSIGGWTKGDVGTVTPSRRYRHASCIIGDNLFVFGGNSGTSLLNDLISLDLGDLRWRSLSSTNAPSPREGHTLSSVGDQLVLIGGEKQTACTNEVFIYDTSHQRWSKVDFPSSHKLPPPSMWPLRCRCW
ncbi:hypothetical protein GEMRC1_002061 [Eukaryota sp. GEM-RC1]